MNAQYVLHDPSQVFSPGLLFYVDVIRRRCRARSRSFTSAGSEAFASTSQRSVALLATLLTFWPPGPPERANVKISSASGTCNDPVMSMRPL